MKKFGRKNFTTKLLMAVLLIAAALCVTACGEEAETPTEELVEASSVESSSDEPGTQDSTEEESQPAEETEGSEGEDSQPAEEEEEEEEAVISWIFSDMPIAAYEVTGLGVGRFDESAGIPYLKDDEEAEMYVEVSDPDDADADVTSLTNPFVKLTPGENTFVIFCMQEDEEEGYISTTAIQSPSGSGQWEAVRYSCLEGYIEMVNFSLLTREDADTYDEETYGGSVYGSIDYWMKWICFSEIYHPDVPQNDAIYVINGMAFSDEDDMDDVLAGMVETFERLGATSVKEIPIEEALERCNVVVSEE